VRRCLRDPTFSRFDTIPECMPRLAKHRAVKTKHVDFINFVTLQVYQWLWLILPLIMQNIMSYFMCDILFSHNVHIKNMTSHTFPVFVRDFHTVYPCHCIKWQKIVQLGQYLLSQLPGRMHLFHWEEEITF